MRLKVSLLACLFLHSPDSSAVDGQSSYERVELNWDTMRIRFYGEAKQSGSLRDTEKEAVKEGISYIVEALPAIRMANLEQGLLGEQDDRSIVQGVSTKTYTYGTTYFSDGRVRVDLESSLPNALAPQGLDFTKDEPSELNTRNTGIVVELPSAMDPQMIYEIQNQAGESLYRLKDVARSEFAKNFMGRFFDGDSKRRLNYFSGEKPINIKGKSKGDRIIVVDGKEWQSLVDGNYGLLEQAKVAIVGP
ncbi:hypothetical protein [Pseudobacteriovorax antillogorgiicola]|uniref:LPP20 lipoprotein n=1 Tax=Pseudobacteriovorax antillogorgiicola TaxID=1513793 RepID=A0A1Y6BA85_9BACT|nr:hypothetical protein [Pseudobacteriovorax antillogorgiicola]TCS59275.1 hypothetical protein EDD56_101180 [Pseudobacteriovorax antillogorgiicola]SME89843.1 hypothetical protein SAMN06296036_101306 [Pseudobacteriovorax antillogorgiicola]